MAKVFLDPDRVVVGAERLTAAGLDRVTVVEILRDPGKYAQVWQEIKWILTGKKEFRDESEKKLDDLVNGIMK